MDVSLLKGIIENYNIIINGNYFYDQPIESNIKQYKEIRKLATGQDEDDTTGCSLDYNYYKEITVDLSRQKKVRCL